MSCSRVGLSSCDSSLCVGLCGVFRVMHIKARQILSFGLRRNTTQDMGSKICFPVETVDLLSFFQNEADDVICNKYSSVTGDETDAQLMSLIMRIVTGGGM